MSQYEANMKIFRRKQQKTSLKAVENRLLCSFSCYFFSFTFTESSTIAKGTRLSSSKQDIIICKYFFFHYSYLFISHYIPTEQLKIFKEATLSEPTTRCINGELNTKGLKDIVNAHSFVIFSHVMFTETSTIIKGTRPS